MSEPPHTDPQKRIRQLEAEVEHLTGQTTMLRADRNAHAQRGRRSTDPAPAHSPLRGRIASARLFLLLMVAYVALAAWLTLPWGNLHVPTDLPAWRHMAESEIGYPLLGVAGCALIALLLYAANRWFLFMGFALAAVYTAFGFFFFHKPDILPLSNDAYVAASLSALTIAYLAFCDLCVRESRRFARGKRRPALLATANSVLFYAVVWRQVQPVAQEWAWVPYAVLGAVALAFARHAETVGAHKNYMVRLFLVKAVILINVALSIGLSGDRLLVALALECAALAIAYRATGIVVVKVLNLIVLAVTTALCIDATKDSHPVDVAGYTVQGNWVTALAVATLMLGVAWFYERLVHGVRPRHRRVSAHWFLADTMADVPKAVASVLHATGAALIVLMLIITDQGDRPELPYFLAVASVALAVLGFVLSTPQLEVGAVMLIVSAHVAFYFFLLMEKPGFVDQPYLAPATAGVAVYTFYGAYRWECFLERFRASSPAEYYASAAAPYAVGTLMIVTLLCSTLPSFYAAPAQNAFGIALMAGGALGRRASWKGAALVALAAGTFGMASALHDHPALPQSPLRGIVLGLLVTYVLAERLLAVREADDLPFAPVSRRARTLLVLAGGAVGFATIYSEADEALHLPLWLGLAVGNGVFGALIMESRYRWTGLALFAAALVGEFVETERLTVTSAATAAAALAILILSWGVVRRRGRARDDTSQDAHLTGSSRHG